MSVRNESFVVDHIFLPKKRAMLRYVEHCSVTSCHVTIHFDKQKYGTYYINCAVHNRRDKQTK